MEQILLCVLSLSGFIGCSDLLRQYFYIPDHLTWTEAQTYCREKYTDLATIESSEEQKVLNSMVLSSGLNSEVWIGVYSEIKWKWSDGYNSLVYANWDVSELEPDFSSGSQFCVDMKDGKWWDYWCSTKSTFVCYRGTQQDPEFIFVPETLTWSDAQTHCRRNFIDLAIVRNSTDNQKIHNLQANGTRTWIGLHRDPNIYWSDETDFSYSNWADVSHPLGNMSVVCGAADVKNSGSWKLKSCDAKFPFVCYSIPVKKHLIKLRVKPKDTSVDLNDPAVKKDLLKKLEKKLTEKGLKGITLKWREQADGKVFQVERKSEKKNRKRTEL